MATEEEKRLAHIEQVRKVGQANKGRKRPDTKKMATERAEAFRQVKEATIDKKILNSAKPIYTNPILLAYRLAKFMVSCDNTEWENSSGKKTGKPYTMAGGKAATGLLSSWSQYISGEKDHFIDQGIEVSREGVQSTTLNDIEDEYLPYTLYLLGDPDGYMSDPTTIDRTEYTQRYKGEYFSDILKRYALIVEAQREEDLYVKGRTSDIFVQKSQYGWSDGTITINRREMVNSVEARQLLEQILSLPEINE